MIINCRPAGRIQLAEPSYPARDRNTKYKLNNIVQQKYNFYSILFDCPTSKVFVQIFFYIVLKYILYICMYIYVLKFIKQTRLNTLAGRLWPASRMFASMVLHTDACNLTKISWIFVQTQHREEGRERQSVRGVLCVCMYVCVGGCLPIDPRRRES